MLFLITIMNKPHFLINDYLENTFNTESLHNFKNDLYKKGILSKYYDKDKLLLIYTNYNTVITSQLQRECRSLVIDIEKLKIISYSCETPLLNNEGYEYLNNNTIDIVRACYEGTFISIFNNNDIWYMSTRKSIQNQDSELKCLHYDMFIDILKLNNYENFNDFCKTLDKNHSYYYTLIHHANKNVIDYTDLFGNNYMKLCLSSIRNNDMTEINIHENILYSFDLLSESIFKSQDTTYENFIEYNKIIHNKPFDEGIIIRSYDNISNKFKLIKLQSLTYQFYKINAVNINQSLLFLYQNNKLYDYLYINIHKKNFLN